MRPDSHVLQVAPAHSRALAAASALVAAPPPPPFPRRPPKSTLRSASAPVEQERHYEQTCEDLGS
eukprot:6313109-Amphidinium_carterae.1